MKMMLDFQHLRERISHLTHDAWNSIVTTTDYEDYDSEYPPPHKWRAENHLARPAQPPALAARHALAQTSEFWRLSGVRCMQPNGSRD